ncbi:MAG: ATP-binding cassette domain-containing protein [Clostridiaceae bacterium]|jgi:ABC-2 type transport system ATP-binding protein|nr:ATP-binding cassette domain-containing protein [Clostridiaceae bacterium]
MRKSYREVTILSGINLNIKKGEIFCLLGSNGAGKTTLINILSTLIKADAGTALVNGYELNKDTKKIRHVISLTGQYAAVDGFLTGRENLELIANLRHMENPNEVVEKMLRQFNLTDAADRQTSTYSGGMRRRLDIAMSLIGEPLLIFLDEPTTGLDPQSRIAMWETIRTLTSQGVTVFLTTQYIEEAEQLADHIAILDKGIIATEGTTQGLFKQYPDAKSLEQVFLSIVESKGDSK